MELKTKYQYTYFIYPYLIEENNYKNYLYKLLKNKNCKLKVFDASKDTRIDSYFLYLLRLLVDCLYYISILTSFDYAVL